MIKTETRSYHRRQVMRWSCMMLLLFTCAYARAQDVNVRSGFLSDSLKIGEQTAYYLSAHYPSNLTILFPDSTFDFKPFEYQKKTFTATQTEKGISRDSAVYYLTTFEIDRVQSLTLPVFVVHPQDCTVIQSALDTVLITQLIAQVPDSIPTEKLPLKMNTAYQNVFFEFNVWIAIGIGVLVVIIIVLVWIFFGKRIGQYFRVRKLTRKHQQFVQAYETRVRKVNTAFSSPDTESALVTWKQYMEQLEAYPYTKLTTKEMVALIKDENLAKNLSSVDRAIYGHDTTVVESLEHLKQFADQRFSRKLEEVKHG